MIERKDVINRWSIFLQQEDEDYPVIDKGTPAKQVPKMKAPNRDNEPTKDTNASTTKAATLKDSKSGRTARKRKTISYAESEDEDYEESEEEEPEASESDYSESDAPTEPR